MRNFIVGCVLTAAAISAFSYFDGFGLMNVVDQNAARDAVSRRVAAEGQLRFRDLRSGKGMVCGEYARAGGEFQKFLWTRATGSHLRNDSEYTTMPPEMARGALKGWDDNYARCHSGKSARPQAGV
ncbi:hypothetical protein PQU92_11640 [Asticcacaulis sp. BYS171W]|uniref:Uncharacterized protein n=1 Tax=Asticcacaulis aquaticus TaxID=2984212 RepID=A0ABT5HWX1_9CAUL|nr:hypothetical protein [Asticcacaulis aquaticus]MDC7683931.1 hypothetical protein [Asticcacaulis aquaticus]